MLAIPQAVSDAHAFLFEERQRLLSLQAANDELRLQEIEDRKRIQQLLGGATDASGKPRQPAPSQYSMDALLLKIESLQAQLHEQVLVHSRRIYRSLRPQKRTARQVYLRCHRCHGVRGRARSVHIEAASQAALRWLLIHLSSYVL